MRVLMLLLVSLGACVAQQIPQDSAQSSLTESSLGDEDWIALFNGRDLTGWVPKIRGNELGEDPEGTFRIEDGLLTVGYENYQTFDERFGHLFYEDPFSDYQLLIEYRFIGTQLVGGPDWAFKNSGVMFHAQNPNSMLRGQLLQKVALPSAFTMHFLMHFGAILVAKWRSLCTKRLMVHRWAASIDVFLGHLRLRPCSTTAAVF